MAKATKATTTKPTNKAARAAAFTAQPAVAAIIKALRSKRGATIAEMQHGRTSHSIRSVLSRLRTDAGLQITRTTHPKRGNVYRLQVRP